MHCSSDLDTGWPTAGHDSQHTGRGSVPGPIGPHVVGGWRFSIPGLDTKSSASPTIGSDGTVYYTTTFSSGSSCLLIAVNGSTGEMVWRLTMNSGTSSSPLLTSFGLVYVAAGNNVLCVNMTTGAQVWQLDSPDVKGIAGATPACFPCTPTGTLFVTGNSLTHAVAMASGALLWSVSVGVNSGGSAMAVDFFGTLYQAGNSGVSNKNFAAIDGATGSVLWAYNMGPTVSAAPAVGGPNNDVVYIGDSYMDSLTGNVSSSGPPGALHALDSSTGMSPKRQVFPGGSNDLAFSF